MEYRLQSIHNRMVGRARSVVSPFYSYSLACTSYDWNKKEYLGQIKKQSELLNE